MNIRDLEYIVTVADKRNFGRAALACNVSQPALSAQIKKLEDQLGFSLFERTPRDIIPTEDALYVLDQARMILEKVANIKKHAHFLKQGHKAKLINLGVIPTIAPYYLSDFFKKLSLHTHAGPLRWQILEEKTQSLIDRLDEGRLDAALMVIPVTGINHPYKKLFGEALYLAVPKGHSLSRLKSITPEDLVSEEWLLLDDGHCLNIPMLDICGRAHNVLQQNSFRATSLETLRHMVASHTGITLIPEMARRKGDGIVYVPLKDTHRYQRTISLVWRENSSVAIEIATLANQIRSQNTA